MEAPFAITLDVGSSHANQTGSWRVERRSTSTGSRRATTPARPGENIQEWLYQAEAGDYETAWRRSSRTTRSRR